MATCRGIDLSVYQGAQDWKARKAEGVVFGFAKASEGQHTHDAHFKTHITGIKAAGLVPGAYHFAWPNQDVATEAANYISAVKDHAGPGFVHWLDLERRSDGANYAGVSAAQIRAYAAAWIADVQKAFPGQRVGVYTAGSDLAAGHAPAGVPLWYPAYPGITTYAQAEAHAKPSPSGRAPLFWQFTSTPIDRSICYMSESALRAWANPQEIDMTPAQEQLLKDVHKAVAEASIKSAVDGVSHTLGAHTAATNGAAFATRAELNVVKTQLTTVAATVAAIAKKLGA